MWVLFSCWASAGPDTAFLCSPCRALLAARPERWESSLAAGRELVLSTLRRLDECTEALATLGEWCYIKQCSLIGWVIVFFVGFGGVLCLLIGWVTVSPELLSLGFLCILCALGA